MDKYVKIWTSILRDEWFMSLSAIERGLWLQLIILAKDWGDTGEIRVKAEVILLSMLTVNRKTWVQFRQKCLQSGRIEYEKTNDFITIKICNYKLYQLDKTSKNGRTGGKNTASSHPLTEQILTEQNRTDHKSECTFQEFLETYNKTITNLPKVRITESITSKRRSAIRARFKDNPEIKYWVRYFLYCDSIPFLCGEGDRNWRASFDWLMNPSNKVKVLEGNYESTSNKKQIDDKTKQILEMMYGTGATVVQANDGEAPLALSV